jgi:hypothetical protein
MSTSGWLEIACQTVGQGNRVKELSGDQTDEKLVVPGGDLTPESDGVFGFGSSNKV